MKSDIIKASLLLAALLIVILALSFLLPWLGAEPFMPLEGAITLREEADGKLHFSWPASPDAEKYKIEYYLDSKLVASEETEKNESVVPQALTGKQARAVITPAKRFDTPIGKFWRYGSDSRSFTRRMEAPTPQGFTYTAGPDDTSLTLRWERLAGESFTLYTRTEDALTQLRETCTNTLTLTFGPEGDLPLPPEEGTELYLAVRREDADCVLYGRPTLLLNVSRELLANALTSSIHLTGENLGQNVFELRWNNARGGNYELQALSERGQWLTLARYALGDELVYRTEHLAPFSSFQYRVIASGGDDGALQDEITLETRETAIYATVWPIQALTLYADEGLTDSIGSVPEGKALCVLDERGNAFRVRGDGVEGWVDNRYTMINLPDFLGNKLLYDIKNSYCAIYAVHDYPIPDITSTVIPGYEYIWTKGAFLVPLQYRTALKLLAAAQEAEEDGYRIKIYDAYRPHKATRYLYDTTELYLNTALPDISDSDAIEVADDTAPTTYYQMMTNDGQYALSHFLARVGSAHNLGIAVDLTLVRMEDGEELKMQSALHDLSYFSATDKNTAYAKYLAKLMTGVGLGTLSSEWWHFQDNELRDTAHIRNYLEAGVSCEGWKASDSGLRYRRADGSYIRNTALTIAGESWRFDENGYAVKE